MARADDTELIDTFEEFYRNYYRNAIGELAQKYPTEQKSLYVDWDDLYRFDPDLADDFRNKPQQLKEYAEEALRLYDLPVDVSLGQAHVRVQNLPESTGIRQIRADHRGSLISVKGIVRKATDVRPKITNAAFECQRCGTLSRIPQTDGDFQEPHECQGCERQGPFRINFDQSEFVDAQKLRIQESPEGLRGGETPQSIDVNIEDDITGEVTAGDHVEVTGILKLEQQGNDREKSAMFDVYMNGLSVTIEDEQFEDMDITDEDKKEIVELSNETGIYEKMVGAIAPSIYGYEKQKLAMILQLFSGVTKHLPDGSRIRGDLHMLLIGDPGTGKCLKGDTKVTLGDGRRRKIRDIVEENLDDPKPVDDGVYDTTDIPLPSLTDNGRIAERTATKVWKREAPKRMYRIRTASGRELEVTPSHPLFVQSGGEFTPRKAEQLREGEFIALPGQVPNDSDITLDVDYRRSEANNAVRLSLPDEWTPWLARLIGFIIAEGYASIKDDNAGSVTITNEDREILDDISTAFERLSLPYSEYDGKDGTEANEIRCSASEFVSFLYHLEPNILEDSSAQRVPDDIAEADEVTRTAFLKAYIDSEGHVSTKQRSLTVSSMSRGLLEDVRSLLLGIGVQSTLEPRQNGSFRLRISGTDFETYVDKVGFVTDRKTIAATAFDGVSQNTNTDIIPDIGGLLREIRESLALSQTDCGLPRSTYQHYERGDRNPSRSSLSGVVTAFERRVEWLRRQRARLIDGDWESVETLRTELGISQQSLADGMNVSQTAISYYEREGVAPDGGHTDDARQVVLDRIDEALSITETLQQVRTLVEGDVRWDRIETVETVVPDYDWVYDLEVAGTHNYISNGVVSHNSAMLQYIRQIAPRSVYTSGKGASSAGLCVTGETMVHTTDGFVPIRDLVTEHHSEPVSEETATEASYDLYTFDHDSGDITESSSSLVWRMPKKPCHRVETAHGKELEATTETPLLVCGESGLEWRAVSDIESGDYVAVPSYDDIDRSSPSIRNFFEFTEEKLKPTDESVEFLRQRLREEFGTLRDAATALDLSEDFIYDSLSNRHLPLDKLGRILDAIEANLRDIDIDRAMLRHGEGVSIPDEFDEDLLYLVGLVFGDGDVMVSQRGSNRGHVRISNSDDALLRTAADIMERKFGKSVHIEYQDDRVPSIRLHSATVARFFSNLGVESPKDDIRLTPELTTAEHADAFLRGLFDADGCVSTREDGGSSVQFSTICIDFARQIQLMLESYGVRAQRRERDRRGTFELETGDEIETSSVQYHLTIYGRDIDIFADEIGFQSAPKSKDLTRIVRDVPRRGERLPLGDALVQADGGGRKYYQNFARGDNPSRTRAEQMLDDRDLGAIADVVEELVDAQLVWDEVRSVTDTGKKEVFDLTVPETHNFIGNGLVTHNTAAAVRDDFGDGQQWTLEAGALVLADKGIAAVDELDKM
ncbi:MAG: LAGLIDADG family homing endonuclease, partial [Haloarculaceae archaeon]